MGAVVTHVNQIQGNEKEEILIKNGGYTLKETVKWVSSISHMGKIREQKSPLMHQLSFSGLTVYTTVSAFFDSGVAPILEPSQRLPCSLM